MADLGIPTGTLMLNYILSRRYLILNMFGLCFLFYPIIVQVVLH
jgi:hypothetical protein